MDELKMYERRHERDKRTIEVLRFELMRARLDLDDSRAECRILKEAVQHLSSQMAHYLQHGPEAPTSLLKVFDAKG